MAAASRFIKGRITTDGTGVGSASIVTTGYRLRSVHIRPVDTGGGLITTKDNNGAGAERLTFAGTDRAMHRTAFGGPTTVVSPLVIAKAAGGGVGTILYSVELVR